jgi:hypothetical protein
MRFPLNLMALDEIYVPTRAHERRVKNQKVYEESPCKLGEPDGNV